MQAGSAGQAHRGACLPVPAPRLPWAQTANLRPARFPQPLPPPACHARPASAPPGAVSPALPRFPSQTGRHKAATASMRAAGQATGRQPPAKPRAPRHRRARLPGHRRTVLAGGATPREPQRQPRAAGSREPPAGHAMPACGGGSARTPSARSPQPGRRRRSCRSRAGPVPRDTGDRARRCARPPAGAARICAHTGRTISSARSPQAPGPGAQGTTVTGHRPARTSRTASEPTSRCPA